MFKTLGKNIFCASSNRIYQNTIFAIAKRGVNYNESFPVPPLKDYPKYEVTKDPKDWEYVERLVPSTNLIPAPPTGEETLPSGWQPQKESAKKLPYFVHRSRNHMLPVYLYSKMRGHRKITAIKRIQGDIWKMEKELVTHLTKLEEKVIGTVIHEITGQLWIRGDHVENVKRWMLKKGL